MPSVLDASIARLGEIILGKEQQLRLALTCLLARGHLLIEDLPGVGKTTLSHALSRVLGLHYQRVQFTSDLLPTDILGVSIYNRDTADFRFHPGPVFANIVLADEINRATPKTQSALLEAMEENQVTIEGESRALPLPFFVIATQNPLYQIGTFPLPESQLDRFLMRIELGYPESAAERQLLQGEDRRALLAGVTPLVSTAQLLALQQQASTVHVADALLDYLQAVLAFSRQSPHFRHGLSPRAGLALLHSARAWAFLGNRDAVLPEDLQSVLPPVVNHRLLADASPDESLSAQSPADLLLRAVPIP